MVTGGHELSPSQVIVREVAKALGQIEPEWTLRDRPDGAFIVFEFAEPNERIFAVVNEALKNVPVDNPLVERVAVVRRLRKPTNVIGIPETRMLQKELSESLTVDRNTFGDDFFSRYTASVTNYETAVIGNANFVVYGRRGSGKSSLLAYAMHEAKERGAAFSWIALQAYSQRDDTSAVASILGEVFSELARPAGANVELRNLAEKFYEIADGPEAEVKDRLERAIPRARSVVSLIADRKFPLTIFLDDIHVLGLSLQPKLLSSLYSLARGNNTFLKVSGIEQFTNIWDSGSRTGLEPPHDAQILRLDHNLTMPDLSKNHIVSILDAHARFCGLPGIAYLAEDDALSRLVLEAAAVPRDALSLFSQAITKAAIKGQKAVTITAMNAAASEAVEEKLKDIGRDATDSDGAEIREMLERVRDFCVRQKNTNAFLVRIDSRSSDYKLMQKLIALRFVHILHEGTTPHKVAERYQALMLDFGFYIGIRAAASIKLFPDTPRILAAKELRKLPIFVSEPRLPASNRSKAKRSAAKGSPATATKPT